MLAICNTSPLLNLAIIDQLPLLQQQFQRISIPPAVEKELMLDKALPGSESLRRAIQSGWIQVTPLRQMHVSRTLRFELDAGESEAIALALELGATRILLDERDARLAARLLGLEPLGLLGILLRAKQVGRLDAVAPLLTQLERQAGFFVAPALHTAILQAAGEA